MSKMAKILMFRVPLSNFYLFLIKNKEIWSQTFRCMDTRGLDQIYGKSSGSLGEIA